MLLHSLSDTKWPKGYYHGYCPHIVTQHQSGRNFQSSIPCGRYCLLIARWRSSVQVLKQECLGSSVRRGFWVQVLVGDKGWKVI